MVQQKLAFAIELEKQLTDFLIRYAEKRLHRYEAEFELSRLEEITFGNSREYWRLDDRFNALKQWFANSGPRCAPQCFNSNMIQRLTRCVEKIGSYCRVNEIQGSAKQSWFDINKANQVAAIANSYLQSRSRNLGYEYTPMGLRLVRPPEQKQTAELFDRKDIEIKDKFRLSLAYQEQVMEYLDDPRRHLFGIVSYLFGEIEKSRDKRAEHMAASILYFLKMYGYKVEPYVQRLRQLRNKTAV